MLQKIRYSTQTKTFKMIIITVILCFLASIVKNVFYDNSNGDYITFKDLESIKAHEFISAEHKYVNKLYSEFQINVHSLKDNEILDLNIPNKVSHELITARVMKHFAGMWGLKFVAADHMKDAFYHSDKMQKLTYVLKRNMFPNLGVDHVFRPDTIDGIQSHILVANTNKIFLDSYISDKIAKEYLSLLYQERVFDVLYIKHKDYLKDNLVSYHDKDLLDFYNQNHHLFQTAETKSVKYFKIVNNHDDNNAYIYNLVRNIEADIESGALIDEIAIKYNYQVKKIVDVTKNDMIDHPILKGSSEQMYNSQINDVCVYIAPQDSTTNIPHIIVFELTEHKPSQLSKFEDVKYKVVQEYRKKMSIKQSKSIFNSISQKFYAKIQNNPNLSPKEVRNYLHFLANENKVRVLKDESLKQIDVVGYHKIPQITSQLLFQASPQRLTPFNYTEQGMYMVYLSHVNVPELDQVDTTNLNNDGTLISRNVKISPSVNEMMNLYDTIRYNMQISLVEDIISELTKKQNVKLTKDNARYPTFLKNKLNYDSSME